MLGPNLETGTPSGKKSRKDNKTGCSEHYQLEVHPKTDYDTDNYPGGKLQCAVAATLDRYTGCHTGTKLTETAHFA